MSDFDTEERDRIAALTRDEMVKETAELDADVMRDDGHRDWDELVRMYTEGFAGRRHDSTKELRDDLYDLADVPEKERRYTDEELKHHTMTMGGMLKALMHNPNHKEGSEQWPVVIWIDLDGDVVIGVNLKEPRLDGFHQTVNLQGMKEGK